jgi:hypothetical protein
MVGIFSKHVWIRNIETCESHFKISEGVW